MTFQPGQVVTNPNNECEICVCKCGTLSCSAKCSDNEKTCLSKQGKDSERIYTWVPPESGECCGKCVTKEGTTSTFSSLQRNDICSRLIS